MPIFFDRNNRRVIQNCPCDITKEKKFLNFGNLIKLCMLKAAGLLLETSHRKKMAKILLSDYTIKTPVDELAKAIECQVLKILQTNFFLIKGDKTIDIANCRSY